MNCQYKYRCKFSADDSLCKELAENCRIHNTYQKQQAENRLREDEIREHYELNDIHLAHIGSGR